MHSRVIILYLCALAVSTPARLTAQSARDEAWRSLEADGLRRSYLRRVPSSAEPNRALPLLLVFHGAGGNAADMERHTALTEVATARGYVVVYPDGVSHRWNDGRGIVSTDDIGFVRALLDSLRTTLPVDPRRIYATGISNGAGMSLRLACDMPGIFAAIAPVAGALAATLEDRCAATSPVSLILFQGTRDPLMPYDGGVLTLRRGRVLAAPRTAELFARVNGCTGPPVITAEPDTVTDGTRVSRSAYPDCRAARDVVLFTIEGGGHTWPGGPPVGHSVGRVTRDLDATRVMLDFFDRHPQP